MSSYRYALPLLAAALFTVPAAQSQTSSAPSVPAPGVSERPAPPSQPAFAAAPFEHADSSSFRLKLIPSAEMSAQDRQLVANAESAIRERAGYQDLDFEKGIWTYSQIACPAFPEHVLLRFTRNNGKADYSVFSVSIPRGGQGRLRVIPVLRRSYSLFSPAAVNETTVAVFNRIRSEEHLQGKPDWVDAALCYAALAGADAPIGYPNWNDPELKTPIAMEPALQVQTDGRTTIRFVTMQPRPREWEMSFDAKGRLVKASHATAQLVTDRPHPANRAWDGHPIAPNYADGTGTTSQR